MIDTGIEFGPLPLQNCNFVVRNIGIRKKAIGNIAGNKSLAHSRS